jgi:hypothetical protein
MRKSDHEDRLPQPFSLFIFCLGKAKDFFAGNILNNSLIVVSKDQSVFTGIAYLSLRIIE